MLVDVRICYFFLWFPVAGQTVSLPIAFGVIFWVYNIDFFAGGCYFISFPFFGSHFWFFLVNFKGTRTIGHRFELFGFICFKRLLLLVCFFFLVLVGEGKVGLNTSHYTV